MQPRIQEFISQVRKLSADPNFLHHQWFVKWHLELVAKISLELCEYYPQANRDMVELLAWLHDYGKIIDRNNEKSATLSAAPPMLKECGIDEQTTQTLMRWMEIFDNAAEADISQAPIEVQIVSSADGCSHLTDPFMQVFWQEFSAKPYEQLMAGNLAKAKRDWERKVVLPEARQAFARRYQAVLEQNGELPRKLITANP